MSKLIRKIGIFFLLFIFILTGAFFLFRNKTSQAIEVMPLNLKGIENGTYIGEYQTNLVSAKVKVEIKNNNIKDIVILKHDCGLGKKAEKITESVISEQSLKVDTVSGATSSSKAILKAVEDALNKN